MFILSNIFARLKPKKKNTPVCEHEWKAVSWYLEENDILRHRMYDVATYFEHKLVAPYVCMKCGKVSEKILSQGATIHLEDHERVIEQIKTHCSEKLVHKTIANGMIADIQMNARNQQVS